jgi:hypothetical protein
VTAGPTGRGPAGPADQPSPEELAAILAAVEMAWPRPVVLVDDPGSGAGPWRFSGRWWSKPHTVQRVRPWVARP